MGTGLISLLLPALRGTVWQTIEAAALSIGFAMLVITMTARQVSLEHSRKVINRKRKKEVYEPLYAELKDLRETLEQAQAGIIPYPRWIVGANEKPPRSLNLANTPMLPTFFFWTSLRTDARVAHFSLRAQRLLDEVHRLALVYCKEVEEARMVMQALLRPFIAVNLTKQAYLSSYHEWLHRRSRTGIRTSNRWFEFILEQMTTIAMPRGESLARSWSRTIGWLLMDYPERAALEMYREAVTEWDAPEYVPYSWFEAIFEETANELKNDLAYKRVQDAQCTLFTSLQEAEALLSKGLLAIRDQYEGGVPLV